MLPPGRRKLAFAAVLLVFTFLFTSWINLGHESAIFGLPGWRKGSTSRPEPYRPLPTHHINDHPLDKIIAGAQHSFDDLLGKRSLTLEDAAAQYRKRRGRHPPPGFDAWFAAALKRDAIIVEEFFDRIHHDINPFWALEPRDLRVQAHTQPNVIRVRNGKVTFVADHPNVLSYWQQFLDWLMPQYRRPLKIELWAELVEEMMPHLPDLDMAVNTMDETRLLVPFDKIQGYAAVEKRARALLLPEDAISEYSGVADIDANEGLAPYEPHWIGGREHEYWDYLRAACPPDSPAHNVASLPDFTGPAEVPPRPEVAYTHYGFVSNFSASQDPCLQPHLRGLHGTFIESISMSTATELFPLFAETKIRQNNEILIPAAAYLTQDALYSGGPGHGGPWATKRSALIWRGVASGGRNKAENWWHFHRHRWVQMLNSSAVAALEKGDNAAAPSFQLPPETPSPPSQEDETWPDISYAYRETGGGLGKWLMNYADASFVDLVCYPEARGEDGEALKTCSYTSPFFDVKPSMPMSEQYDYKYLPDVDGNSFSGRWRGFLLSTSMPLKATIYSEWHDDRIFPWVHFAPFDSTYLDIYGVMDYFLDGRDEAAHKIAEQGRQWAEKVYRRDDMVLYVWRLLLEYARVVDDRRDRLGFAEDLR